MGQVEISEEQFWVSSCIYFLFIPFLEMLAFTPK